MSQIKLTVFPEEERIKFEGAAGTSLSIQTEMAPIKEIQKTNKKIRNQVYITKNTLRCQEYQMLLILTSIRH